jgi:hypothetical protein
MDKVVRVGVSLFVRMIFLAVLYPSDRNCKGWHIYADFHNKVFITDMANFAEMNGEYEKWFTHKPARTCVAVYQLPKGVPVEIEALALQ